MKNFEEQYKSIVDIFIQLYRHKRDIDDNYNFWQSHADSFGGIIREQGKAYWNAERLKTDNLIYQLSLRVNDEQGFADYARANLSRVSAWGNEGDVDLSSKNKTGTAIFPRKLIPR